MTQKQKDMKGLDREFILKAVKNTDGKSVTAVKINSSEAAADYARAFYSDDINIYESAFIILVNRQLNTIGWAKIGQGGVAGVMVDAKIVCKYAIDALAAGVIFVHNHPSGVLLGSPEDQRMNTKLKAALETLDMKLFDSIILTDESYYSFCDNGRL